MSAAWLSHSLCCLLIIVFLPYVHSVLTTRETFPVLRGPSQVAVISKASSTSMGSDENPRQAGQNVSGVIQSFENSLQTATRGFRPPEYNTRKA